MRLPPGRGPAGGRDIAQCAGPAGFSPTERLATLGRGSPAIYHSVGVKPWQHGAAWRYGRTPGSRARARYEDLHLRLSPYTAVARRFAPGADVLGRELAFEPCSALG